eukprot:scaffold91996_cov63-Phaeocystis_antarctica.AAC.5
MTSALPSGSTWSGSCLGSTRAAGPWPCRRRAGRPPSAREYARRRPPATASGSARRGRPPVPAPGSSARRRRTRRPSDSGTSQPRCRSGPSPGIYSPRTGSAHDTATRVKGAVAAVVAGGASRAGRRRTSAIAVPPTADMPMPKPTRPCSLMGMLSTRSGPNSSSSPCVQRNTPPNPTSSPNTTACGLDWSSILIASLMAVNIFICFVSLTTSPLTTLSVDIPRLNPRNAGRRSALSDRDGLANIVDVPPLPSTNTKQLPRLRKQRDFHHAAPSGGETAAQRAGLGSKSARRRCSRHPTVLRLGLALLQGAPPPRAQQGQPRSVACAARRAVGVLQGLGSRGHDRRRVQDSRPRVQAAVPAGAARDGAAAHEGVAHRSQRRAGCACGRGAVGRVPAGAAADAPARAASRRGQLRRGHPLGRRHAWQRPSRADAAARDARHPAHRQPCAQQPRGAAPPLAAAGAPWRRQRGRRRVPGAAPLGRPAGRRKHVPRGAVGMRQELQGQLARGAAAGAYDGGVAAAAGGAARGPGRRRCAEVLRRGGDGVRPGRPARGGPRRARPHGEVWGAARAGGVQCGHVGMPARWRRRGDARHGRADDAARHLARPPLVQCRARRARRTGRYGRGGAGGAGQPARAQARARPPLLQHDAARLPPHRRAGRRAERGGAKRGAGGGGGDGGGGGRGGGARLVGHRGGGGGGALAAGAAAAARDAAARPPPRRTHLPRRPRAMRLVWLGGRGRGAARGHSG